MLKNSLAQIFERDLNNLKKEIESYPDENKLWIVKEGINNSAGNLCLHLTGNLKHFFGAVLGNSGYVRKRDDEFALKNIPRSGLIKQIDETILVIKNTLNNMSQEDFEKNYPIDVRPEKVTIEFWMLHLLSHFSYHLGQINYHRRLLG